MHQNPKRLELIVLSWFFFSGMAALIYEVLWARELELVLGSTLYAVSTILSVFMAGLAIGSFLLGRVADRIKNPLLLYGLLEVGIGVYAALTPLIFKAVPLLQSFIPHPAGVSTLTIAFISSFVALIIPATLMGGTLPVITKFLVNTYERIGNQVGKLYFINTLGAAIGTFLAGFVLMATFGLIATTYIAAVINLAIGGAVVLFQRYLPAPSAARSQAETSDPPPATPPQRSHPLYLSIVLLIGYGLAGFAALSLEVLWTRVLVLVIGSSVYAFSLMLSAFLLGIALGSSLMSRFVDRLKNLWLYFALVEIAIGIVVAILNPLLGESPLVFLRVFLSYGQSFWLLQAVEFGLIFLVMLIPTTLMGAAFPLVSKLYAEDVQHLGRYIANIYSVNTMGCILGPLATSFVLIPLIGMQTSLWLTSLIFMVVGGAVLVLAPAIKVPIKSVASACLALMVVLGFFVIPAWNKSVITSGVYYHTDSYATVFNAGTARQSIAGRNLAFYKEGQLATVAVIDGADGNRFLTINGKAEASTTGDMHTQLLSGHLGMLLQEQPKKVLLVGLGSGITLGAVLQHPTVEKVDAVEIEPAVVEAATYFSQANHDAVNDPRVNMVITDARNFVLVTKEKYDVITAEPTNPFVSSSSSLFSKELFEIYRERLNDNGIVVQWFHMYFMGNEELRTMINTFRTVFPHTTMWGNPTDPDLMLVGALKPLTIDFQKLQNKLQGKVKEDLARVKIDDPYLLLSYFQMDEESLARYSGSAPVNTDSRPRLEFSAPKYLHASTIGINAESMNGFRSSVIPLLRNVTDATVKKLQDYMEFRQHAIKGLILRIDGQQEEAAAEYELALSLVPGNRSVSEALADIYEWLGSVSLGNQDSKKAEEHLRREIALSPNRASPHISLGIIALARRQPDQAIAEYAIAARIAPYDPIPQYDLGYAYISQGEYQKALPYLDRAIELSPNYTPAYANRGFAYLYLGDYPKAIVEYTRAIELDPQFTRAYYDRGQVYYRQEDYKKAIADFSKVISLAPENPEPYSKRGMVNLQLGLFDRAVKDFTQALAVEPSAIDYDNRALAYARQGRYDLALPDANKAIEVAASYDLPYYRRAYILERLGRKAEAIADYEKYLTVSGNRELIAESKKALDALRR